MTAISSPGGSGQRQPWAMSRRRGPPWPTPRVAPRRSPRLLMPLFLVPPPRAARTLLAPTVPHLARILLARAPETPPLLLEIIPASPSLLTPLLCHLLLSHSQPIPAFSHFRRLLALPSFPVPEGSLPVRLLAQSRRYAHLSFPLLESLSATHPHLLSTPALAVLLSTPLSASAPGASFDAAVTCFDSAARVWARAGHAFGTAELNALLRAFSARGRVAKACALFHRYCDAYPPDTRTFNTLLLGFKEARNGRVGADLESTATPPAQSATRFVRPSWRLRREGVDDDVSDGHDVSMTQ